MSWLPTLLPNLTGLPLFCITFTACSAGFMLCELHTRRQVFFSRFGWRAVRWGEQPGRPAFAAPSPPPLPPCLQAWWYSGLTYVTFPSRI